ncbi:cytochrome C biogenesis protein [Methylophaga sp. 42_25_T18]|nr:cytochrome C biogenesis protein [Methylophaga sp. 42_25_T18]OUR87165.1 cytochrome C biogenesis protein [Methylophaga sp. 42_8_T64]
MKKILFLLLFFITSSINAGPGLLQSLGLNDDFDVPPSVDEAFKFSIEATDADHLLARWQIADGNYLYRNKINFEIINNNDVQLLPFSLPAGENKMDEIFGLSEVYLQDTDANLPLNRKLGSSSEITLKAYYQGCSETFHICYPPTTKEIKLTLPEQIGESKTVELGVNTQTTIIAPLSEQDRLAQSLAQDSLAKILLGFFGVGILLAFTPCVFPMIPILSSIIAGEGENITTHRAFILSVTYVLAMSVTYTTAGVLTGLLGENLQATFQSPWIIGSFSAVFVILALSMFGLFELQLPHFMQRHLHKMSHQQQGGTLIGVALMGLVSGVIVGPCLAPPLAGALIFIGQHGDPLLGGAALFALSLGMGVPLIAIGTSEGSLLPRAGDWMNTIKSVFGILMLGLAIWMLERIIPGWIGLLLWGALLIVTAIYLGALNSLGIDANGWAKFWKGIGLLLLIYGGLLIVGGASGSHNVWQPLNMVSSGNSAAKESADMQFTQINNLSELNQFLAQTTQPVMLDFYADWCVDCKKMEVTTFRNAEVKAATANWQLLQVDVTANTADHQALLKELTVFGPPTILFFDPLGEEYSQHRLVGGVTAAALIKHFDSLPK